MIGRIHLLMTSPKQIQSVKSLLLQLCQDSSKRIYGRVAVAPVRRVVSGTLAIGVSASKEV